MRLLSPMRLLGTIPRLFVLLGFLTLVGCDSNDDPRCSELTPAELEAICDSDGCDCEGDF